jgi:predicted negative regulator of RcsB-dependent stress response
VFNTHLSDDEQAEALKRWWSENGKSVIGGIVLGLVLVFGWRGWNEHQQNQAEQASAEYDRLLVSLQGGDIAAAKIQAEKISGEYSSTAYDFFAAMNLAKTLVDADDLAGAKLQLEFAVANADDEGLKQLAQSRLARVLVAMNDTRAARSVAANLAQSVFAGDAAAVEGDILRADGNNAAAADAYRKALENNATNRRMIEMKLNEVKQDGSGS